MLVAGSTLLPVVAPLLIGVGAHDVTLWNEPDARCFPLPRAARDADVVIDRRPDGPDIDRLDADRPSGSVLTAPGAGGSPAVAAGVLGALRHSRGPREVTVGLLAVAVHAAAVAAPPRRPLLGVLRANVSGTIGSDLDSIAVWSVAAAVQAAVTAGLGRDDRGGGWGAFGRVLHARDHGHEGRA